MTNALLSRALLTPRSHLTDAEEFVIVKVLATLTTLTERRFLTKGETWELVAQMTGFLCHPNIWIREGELFFSFFPLRRHLD